MSSITGPMQMTPPTPAEPVDSPSPSYAAQVIGDTVAQWQAKIALAWIAVIAILACLAPIVASSNPILIRIDGHWSSPMLNSLSWIDLVLLVLLGGITALQFFNRLGIARKLCVLALGVLAVSCIYWWRGPAPQNMVYERFRDAQKSGHVQFVLNAPIPFSASDRLRDQLDPRLMPPSPEHWLGTEEFGADVLSRMIHACRIALAMGFVASGIAVLIGIIVGGIMGYFAGITDILGMRLIEIFEAIPTLFLMITLVAFFPSEDYRLPMLMIIIGIVGWTPYARYLRAEFLSLRQRDFVYAAQAAGLPLRSILFRHMLPNGITSVVINLSFGIAGAILAESTLSFLQLGVVDQPSWGAMLSQATGQGGQFVWWMALYPGLAIFLTVFAYILLGEAVNDALDPRRRR
ncbi:MAG: ABC transporter permease [Tepidisphaeraceae bacterium]